MLADVRWLHALGSVLALVLLALTPAQARAQNTFCAGDAGCTAGVSVTSSSTTLVVGLVTMYRMKNRKIAWVAGYARQNRHALLSDLAVGAGPVLQDLAAAFAVAELGPWARALRRRRLALDVALQTRASEDTDASLWDLLREAAESD